MKLEPAEFLSARILVVDDQDVNVLLLEEFLAAAGYRNVESTTRALDVCPLHRRNQYDLILLDLNMPEMDGFKVMECLKAIDPKRYLPVLVLTAEPAHKLRALQAGAKDFISKPFDLVEVRTRIHNMLEVRLLYRKLEQHNELLEQEVRARTADLADSEARYRRLTELASDWYWEQNESGDFTRVSGPVEEMMGLRITTFLADGTDAGSGGWNQDERAQLQAKIAARQPFTDFAFRRVNPDRSVQHFRVSGEPMFDTSCHYTGYRGIGAEVTGAVPHVLAVAPHVLVAVSHVPAVASHLLGAVAPTGAA